MDITELKHVVYTTEKSKVHVYIGVAEDDWKKQSCMKQHDIVLSIFYGSLRNQQKKPLS